MLCVYRDYPIFVLIPKCCIFSREAANTNFYSLWYIKHEFCFLCECIHGLHQELVWWVKQINVSDDSIIHTGYIGTVQSETMFTRNCELDNILRENLVK